MNDDIQSISFIDNREFPGVGDTIPPGPLGYQLFIYSKPITIVPNLMFLLNNWLADGLLVSFASFLIPTRGSNVCRTFQLYRCYVIYALNVWVIVFPCLVYLASVGTYLVPLQASHTLS